MMQAADICKADQSNRSRRALAARHVLQFQWLWKPKQQHFLTNAKKARIFLKKNDNNNKNAENDVPVKPKPAN